MPRSLFVRLIGFATLPVASFCVWGALLSYPIGWGMQAIHNRICQSTEDEIVGDQLIFFIKIMPFLPSVLALEAALPELFWNSYDIDDHDD